ncbi:MAG: D-glycerate dehydrogenase [Oligoflexia bacterium]|nr:D-glycerate dehydrogenase [Oligoflexia bacterium]
MNQKSNSGLILLTDRILEAPLQQLIDHGLEVDLLDTPLEDPKSQERIKDAVGLITMLCDKIDKEFIAKNSHLKIINNYAVGTNNIDRDACEKAGIIVGNTPDVLTNASADLALTLLLGVTRRLNYNTAIVKEGRWKKWEPIGVLGNDLTGKTLGIYGMGRIGQAFAYKCQKAFDMNVIYYNHREKEIIKGLEATPVNESEIFSNSDVLSFHCPLTESTKGKINKENLATMKSGSFLINISRGEVHREEDILWAINEGILGGVGLDVTNPEPMTSDSPLFNHPDVLVTPHIGSGTIETRMAMTQCCVDNILQALGIK